MDLQLAGQAAVVTGSSRGIGASIARNLAREGVSVVVSYSRDREGAGSVCAEIEAGGGRAATFQADVADPRAAAELIHHCVGRFGRLDILVNNAGAATRAPFVETSQEQFDLVMNTNLRGTWNCSQAAAAHMVQVRYGRILNCSSMAAVIPQAGLSAYAASKAAILALTRTMAGELAPYNILVNTYVPGTFNSPQARRSIASRAEELLSTIGLRRFGQVDEIGSLAAFLVSPLNSYMSGAAIQVDGAKLALQNPMTPWRDAGLLD